MNERENMVYEFMLLYQKEHQDDIKPPTMQDIATACGLAGRNVVHQVLLSLVRQGLVSVRARGTRKYVAMEGEDAETEETEA